MNTLRTVAYIAVAVVLAGIDYAYAENGRPPSTAQMSDDYYHGAVRAIDAKKRTITIGRKSFSLAHAHGHALHKITEGKRVDFKLKEGSDSEITEIRITPGLENFIMTE